MNVPCLDECLGSAVRASCTAFSKIYNVAMALPMDSPERTLLFSILGDVHTSEVLLSSALSELRNAPSLDTVPLFDDDGSTAEPIEPEDFA